MFFLSASANILVYLLVPAFFIISLYFNGELQEEGILIPDASVRNYIPESRDIFSKDTYIYQINLQEPIEEDQVTEEYIDVSLLPHSPGDYTTQYPDNTALRAPPANKRR